MMETALVWSLGVALAVFLIVLGMEAVLSWGADEDDWWKTKEAWIQPLIAGGGAGGSIFMLWMVALWVKYSF